MTAGTSIVNISNRALLSIGARTQISNINEGSTAANAILTLYPSTFTALARSAAWNCLRNQASLTLIAAAQGTPENPDGATLPLPPPPWLYQYVTPSDNLQIRYLLPPFTNSTPSGSIPQTPVSNLASPWVPGACGGRIPFSVAYATDSNNNPIETVLTNQTQALVVYTVNQQNPTIWDSLFEQAMVASLAAYLVPALSLDLPLMDRQVKIAEAAIVQARVRDGDEGLTTQDRQADWIRARTTGYLYDYGGAGSSPWGFWSNMVWP